MKPLVEGRVDHVQHRYTCHERRQWW